MRAKTVFIIIITAAVTAILVNNTDDMNLWLFGEHKFPKLGVLGSMLAAGFILGLIVRSGSSRKASKHDAEETYRDEVDEDETAPYLKKTSTLSEEDRDYIS
ncbi:hypothetical protein [Desertivirga brevis]|uniref:hypothetical protein n=1 Tax=Desertivirga brevis TaxID=2810310 RepID=UPI001A975EC5|nr:hypothetical protein [Pedobacter sp. SYSU D00873]